MAKEEILSLGGSPESLDLITFQELVQGNLSAYPDRKKERDLGKLFTYKVLNGQRSTEWRETTRPVDTNINQISGSVAYPGKAQGKVHLVFSFDGKGVSFSEGEILVAPHTSPNLIELMRRAAAIITDEGGITSHAAIVSRELKKPCIIGTKIATQVLKDGNLVEVDADKGIVKILGKAETKK
jgi:phosphoenolpyruvate synthase/pyruvate phosphate dikinase